MQSANTRWVQVLCAQRMRWQLAALQGNAQIAGVEAVSQHSIDRLRVDANNKMQCAYYNNFGSRGSFTL